MNDWKITRHASGFVSISGHIWPTHARIVLLDDINKLYYLPIGCNSFNEVLYIDVPYPVSHTCAVEDEMIYLLAKAKMLVRELAMKGAFEEK